MSDTEQRNMVLVTIDSLRADHCGYINGEHNATPKLSEMAENGLVFENAVAPGPSTPESMPVIFTGEYPNDNGAFVEETLSAYHKRIRHHMSARNSLPERLSKHGYSTAAFTPNPFTSRHFGFDQGFDHFQDFMRDKRDAGDLYDRIFSGFLNGESTSSIARVLLNLYQGEEVFKSWESYYDEIIEWATDVNEPYFIWVFLMDAHNPYLPNSEYRSQSRLSQFHANFRFWRESHETPFSPAVHDRLVTAYKDAVQYSDQFLRQLESDLKADDPIFIIHGDHGEAFGEHGSYGHEPYLYPENVHVPLIVSGIDPNTVSNPVSLRCLPDYITNLSTGSFHQSEWSTYAVSRTSQGSDTAVYTSKDYYIHSEHGSRELTKENKTVFETIVDRVVEFQREKNRIGKAVSEVTNI